MEERDREVSLRIPVTLFGVGSAKNVGMVAKGLAPKGALIVTDQGVVQAGLLDVIKESLEKESIPFGVFDGCLPDAPLGPVEEAAKIAKEKGYDLLIGVGGGSVMDSTKMASIRAVTDESMVNFVGVNKIKVTGLPQILIPTTAGTGSEWSRGAIFTDPTDGQKKTIISDSVRAGNAIIDPLMTLNLPQRVTADTGMDVLCHAIEGYTGWRTNVLSDMFAEKAIKLVSENLRLAYAKGQQHIEARYNMSIAAALAIETLSLAGYGLPHALNYPVAVKAHLSHGTALTLLLPYIMEFNIPGNPTKFAKIAELMGEEVDGLSLMERADKSVAAVRRLAQDLGMPQRLGEVGIKEEDISGFIDYFFEFESAMGGQLNPRAINREELQKLLERTL